MSTTLATKQSPKTFLTGAWRALAMVNFPVSPELLQPLVPAGTRLDFFHGETFLSVVGFLFRDTRVLGLPIPGHRHFPEVNLRFYVVREVDGEVRRGVVFIRELAPKWAVCQLARVLYNEQYYCVPMCSEQQGFSASGEVDRQADRYQVTYQWRIAERWHSLHMNAHGSAAPLVAGSHEEFIAEHYWGYCRQKNGGTIEYRVDHPSWRAWHDAEVRLDADLVATYGSTYGPRLAAKPTSAFLADGSPIRVSRPILL